MIIIASYSNVSVTYTADGTQTVFSFPFDYLRKAFVLVEVNEETILTQGTDYSVSNKTVVFNTAPANGTILRIFRQTDTRPLVSWADASVLRAKDMTVQQIQELHILEEQDYWVKENAIIRNGKQWNARNFPIKNVGDPVDAKDAVNKQYADSNFMKLDDAGDSWEGRGLPVENIATPGKVKDAATKEYVDRLIDGLSIEADRYVVFNNVAAMKAANLPAGYNTRTLGYWDINDGGAGVYSIRGAISGETYDDGSLIRLNNGNVAVLIANGKVCPEQWGAKGDGVTDDTVPLQKCFAFGDVIELGCKTYALDGCIEISKTTELYTNSTFFKVINEGVKDYDAVIKIVGNSTDVHHFHHQGKLYIDCAGSCNIGLWIEARTPNLALDWLFIKCARVWGIYDNSRNANYKIANFIECAWCGCFIRAKASYLASNKMQIEFTSGEHWGRSFDLNTPWFSDVFNNKYSQFDFVLDDSSYGIPGQLYRRHNFGTAEDTGVLGTVDFNVLVGVLNNVPSDYLNRDVFIPLGGGICLNRGDSSCCNVGTYTSLANARSVKINCMYNPNFGTFGTESDGVCLTLNLNYGATISCYYEENLGHFLSAPDFKRVIVASYYSKNSTMILNGLYGTVQGSCVLQSYLPSGRPTDDTLKQKTLVSMRDLAYRNMFKPYFSMDNNYKNTITENHPQIYMDRRMYFSGSNPHFLLDITDISCLQYAGFAPVEIYGECTITHTGAKMNIALSDNLVSQGFTLKNSVNNMLSIDTSSVGFYKLTILLCISTNLQTKEFSVFFETLTPATNAT